MSVSLKQRGQISRSFSNVMTSAPLLQTSVTNLAQYPLRRGTQIMLVFLGLLAHTLGILSAQSRPMCIDGAARKAAAPVGTYGQDKDLILLDTPSVHRRKVRMFSAEDLHCPSPSARPSIIRPSQVQPLTAVAGTLDALGDHFADRHLARSCG